MYLFFYFYLCHFWSSIASIHPFIINSTYNILFLIFMTIQDKMYSLLTQDGTRIFVSEYGAIPFFNGQMATLNTMSLALVSIGQKANKYFIYPNHWQFSHFKMHNMSNKICIPHTVTQIFPKPSLYLAV